ncbi:DUF3800 domain-containing protein [Mesorhizobium sp. L-8-3]|uniref:DUF3800 domain-containing protein n=1 Tax=Mesorhizobium sp. L-8-3 TaxID=2744522 RepID=UPI001927ED40|nr:DUF3800 domain-containing protein [Mesorhizobium sp. L-8-3]BCH22091.1 hypothetical protein MesoLjLb_18760 [Mesorhizobium sp. L-8-3]
MAAPSFRMFIDDTGNVHSRVSDHPQSRYAGIVGVIVSLDYLYNRFEPSFELLKVKHFGNNPPILHLRKMKKAEGRFQSLKDADVRAAWEKDCFSMYERAQYTVISVCVDKAAFYAAHPNWHGGIYRMLVGNAIERYFYFLRSNNAVGDVMSEATNSQLDGELKALYRSFYEGGTDHIPEARLRPRLSSKEIKIQPKVDDIAGLQLADLLASTCFSHCKRIYTGGPEFDAFAMKVAALLEAEKFYRSRSGNPNGYGRIWRP